MPVIKLKDRKALSKVLSPLDKEGILFDTAFSRLSLMDGQGEVDDKRAVIDANTGAYIATVGNKYNLINNRECFTNFANTLSRSGINIEGMKVKVFQSRAKYHVDFTFPKHSVEVRPNDLVELSINTRNSYDGTSRFIITIGGFRLLCSNGMGIGSYTNVYSNKHSSGYSEKIMEKYLLTALTVFEKAGEEWQKMVGVSVTDDQAFEVLNVFTNTNTNFIYEEIIEGRPSRLREALKEWDRYKNSMGSNKFALYNTVTHLSTHFKTEGDVVWLKSHKEKLRDKALSSHHFTELRKVA